MSLTLRDLEALPAAKFGDGLVVPPASHMRMTPLPLEAFLISSRNSVFSSTGLQHNAWWHECKSHASMVKSHHTCIHRKH